MSSGVPIDKAQAVHAGGESALRPPFIPLVRATPVAWHVTPGIAEWSNRRRHSLLQSVGTLRGQTGAAWKESPLQSNQRGAILAERIERKTVERTSVSGGRSTLRGELRNRRPQRLAHRVRAVRHPGACGKCGRGTTVLFTRHARTTEGCAVGSRRGFASSKVARTFARSGRSTEPMRPRMHVDLVARRLRRLARVGKGRT